MIYKPFNITFLIIAACFTLIMVALIKMLRKKTRTEINRFIIGFYLICLTIFFLYKFHLIHDTPYLEFTGLGPRSILEELPLYPCNIVMLLMPFAVITEKRVLLGYCFFTSMICAPMALMLPSDGFLGFSILTPRVMGFVCTHYMVFAAWAFLYFLDIYTPEYKDISRYLLTAITIAFVVFLINIALKSSGLCRKPNYFFTMYPESNEMRMLYDLIPIKFIYTMPAYVVLAGIAYIITAKIKRDGPFIRKEKEKCG